MKKTARELADEVMSENRPIDYQWLRHLLNSCKSEKEALEWARNCIYPFTNGESKQLIGRAAKLFLEDARDEMRRYFR